MKKIFFISLMLATASLSAQQKNTMLDQSFWKANPDVAAVKAEIAKGNNPAESNQRNMDVTTTAILGGASADVVKFLVDQPGNSVDKITHEGRTYLHWAAMKGNPQVVNVLLVKGSDLNMEEEHGLTPAYLAAANGGCTVAMFETFVKNGLDLKKKYKDGATLLLLALPADKDFSVTEYFVSKGLSIKDTDSKGNTAINYASKGGNIEAIKKLLQQSVKYNDDALLSAAAGTRRSANSIEIYKYLVDELKIKPTVSTKNGETVLHLIAGKQNQSEIVSYFMAKGIDVNKADNDGNTAFMQAAGGKDAAVATLLLPKVKNINAVNSKGESAISIAVKDGSADVVALLLKNGADSNYIDKEGNNLAYYLIQSYRAPRGGYGDGGKQTDEFGDKMKALQSKGLNVSAPQKGGNTLYHLALVKNDLVLLKKLEPLKIDVNAKNKEGLTALHKAAMLSKDDAILKYLLSIGAKKGIVTELDETAYALAKENESLTKSNVSVDFLK